MRRLLWRAGFGATEAEARRWARRGRAGTLDWLLAGDGAAELRGPAPLVDGQALDPENEFGHDVLWWLDRMVRTSRPLEEKLTLFWHDHFATTNQPPPLMLRQNRALREHALGSFPALLRAVLYDPAMQQFLTLAGSHRNSPNENFARELMELFTIGTGYSEDDVREASRALTGFVAIRENGRVTGTRFDPARHDGGAKTIFGRTGAWRPEDVLDLCVAHPNHAPFLVDKLWAFFVGTPLEPRTRGRLVRTYVGSGHRIAPVVRRILAHPHLYRRLDAPWMVKSPVVLVAGLLRATGTRVERRQWVYLLAGMGQLPFRPPSVAGWEWGEAWMSSNTMRQRFLAAGDLVRKGGPAEVRPGSVDPGLGRRGHIDAAAAAVGAATVPPHAHAALRRLHDAFAVRDRGDAETLQRAMRHLLVSGPDNQLH